MARALGKQESALLAYVQMRDLREIRSGDLTGPLKITPRQESTLLYRMNQRGLIAQVRKGLYLVPAKLPLGGVWTPSQALAINCLMKDKNAKYQVCGPNAFSRYGFDEQIPSRIYIYNDAVSGQRKIGSIELTLIKVKSERLGLTDSIADASGELMVFSSRARTLMDAVYDWSRFDSLPRAYQWIRNDIESGKIKATELAESVIQYGNTSSIRRIGAILEKIYVKDAVLELLEREISSTTAKIPLVPEKATKGSLMKRWSVVDNE